MWIARNKDGTLALFQTKPKKILGFWESNTNSLIFNSISFSCSYTSEIYKQYSFLKYTDEPIEVEIVSKITEHS